MKCILYYYYKLQLLQRFHSSLDFVRDNLGELELEETFTHSQLSWSSITPYSLPPSFMIHGILLVQFTCVTVSDSLFSTISKFSLVYLLAWHPPVHTSITKSLSSFRSTCPYHCNLFCCSTKIMSSNPTLYLNPLLGTLSSSSSL